MADLSNLPGGVKTADIEKHIMACTPHGGPWGGGYQHVDGTDGNQHLSDNEIRRMLPMDELVRAARFAYPQGQDVVEMGNYATLFATSFMQVLYSSATGLDFDIILIGLFGETLEELTERSPCEARWYTKAYRVGVARGIVNASASLVRKASGGDLASQRLYLEHAGVINNPASKFTPGNLPSVAPGKTYSKELISSFQDVFNENF
jgi:hypothetical protein